MKSLMQSAGFDKIETEFFCNLYTILSVEDKLLMQKLQTEFLDSSDTEVCASIKHELKKLADKYGKDEKAFCMLLAVISLDILRQKYITCGLGEQMYYDISKDFKYKLDECKKVHGLYGTMSFVWAHKIFNMEILSLGRFQYQKDVFFDKPYTYGDITVNPGDEVVRFHIPSSGSMPKESRIDSYKRAFEFYGKKKGEYLVITCVSWLLYPALSDVYPQGSNLLDFMNDFDIVGSVEPSQPFSNAWRVFGVPYDGGDTSLLPVNTTLQKNFAAWLAEGNHVGSGKGVIIFDGEKIVNV